jgi:NADH:ubiquinone oxidoreductase subunit F (NADH-binding)
MGGVSGVLTNKYEQGLKSVQCQAMSGHVRLSGLQELVVAVALDELIQDLRLKILKISDK